MVIRTLSDLMLSGKTIARTPLYFSPFRCDCVRAGWSNMSARWQPVNCLERVSYRPVAFLRGGIKGSIPHNSLYIICKRFLDPNLRPLHLKVGLLDKIISPFSLDKNLNMPWVVALCICDSQSADFTWMLIPIRLD